LLRNAARNEDLRNKPQQCGPVAWWQRCQCARHYWVRSLHQQQQQRLWQDEPKPRTGSLTGGCWQPPTCLGRGKRRSRTEPRSPARLPSLCPTGPTHQAVLIPPSSVQGVSGPHKLLLC